MTIIVNFFAIKCQSAGSALYEGAVPNLGVDINRIKWVLTFTSLVRSFYNLFLRHHTNLPARQIVWWRQKLPAIRYLGA